MRFKHRVLDANLNRLKEGIRVIEDILRYLFDDKVLALELKNLRHLASFNPSFKINAINTYVFKNSKIKFIRFYTKDSLLKKLFSSRDCEFDVLSFTIDSEARRDNLKAIILANFKRAQESSRVLEELLKLEELCIYGEFRIFKSIRYALYSLEARFFLSYSKDSLL